MIYVNYVTKSEIKNLLYYINSYRRYKYVTFYFMFLKIFFHHAHCSFFFSFAFLVLFFFYGTVKQEARAPDDSNRWTDSTSIII